MRLRTAFSSCACACVLAECRCPSTCPHGPSLFFVLPCWRIMHKPDFVSILFCWTVQQYDMIVATAFDKCASCCFSEKKNAARDDEKISARFRRGGPDRARIVRRRLPHPPSSGWNKVTKSSAVHWCSFVHPGFFLTGKGLGLAVLCALRDARDILPYTTYGDVLPTALRMQTLALLGR